MKIAITKPNPGRLLITFNRIPHLILNHPVTAIQSWQSSDAVHYCIEYTLTQGNEILCEYTDRKLWQRLLKDLAKFFDIAKAQETGR